MNERIRQLAEQAEEYAAQNATGDWEVGPAYQDLYNKKFAELIVRECAEICLEANDHKNILRYFGVEE
jgi:hypothetical protein